MDATARSALPPGVSDTRLPPWMLPDIPPALVMKFRPDLLIIEGLTHVAVSSHNMFDPAVLSHFQAFCIIHLLELGYTSDYSLHSTLTKKHLQHVELCRSLISAGWTLHLSGLTPYHILILGFSGIVFKPALSIFDSLGISAAASRSLLKKLVVHAVRTAHSIVCLRRSLEWSFPSDNDPP